MGRRAKAIWNALIGIRQQPQTRKGNCRPVKQGRSLRLEGLEDRRMLATTFTVNSILDDGDGGNITLREAIAAAVASVDNENTVKFDETVFANGGTILLQNQLVINGSDKIIIDGTDSGGVPLGIVIDAQQNSRVFNIILSASGTNEEIVILDSLTITGGDTDNSGGGIEFDGTTFGTDALVQLQIVNSKITGNTALGGTGFGGGGGGVYAFLNGNTTRSEASLIIRDSDISGNSAAVTSLLDNQQVKGGGGVYIFTTGLRSEIINSTITGNDSLHRGGGVFFYSDATDTSDKGHLLIKDSTISGNNSLNAGGGISAFLSGSASNPASSNLTIENSTISSNGTYDPLFPNASTTDGGGLFVAGFIVSSPGGIPLGGVQNGTVNINNTTITNNQASNRGGGALIFLSQDSTALISNSTITGNRTFGIVHDIAGHDGGGGLYLRMGLNVDDSGAYLKISDSTISDNTAELDGGGILAIVEGTNSTSDQAKFKIANSTISGNTAVTGTGGGAYVCEKYGGTFEVDHTTFSGNYATDATNGKGGGLSLIRERNTPLNGFNVDINFSTITNNFSPDGGGLYSGLIGSDTGTSAPVNTKLSHTIISGNFTVPSGIANNVAGSIDPSSDYNFVGSDNGVFHTSLTEGSPRFNIRSDTPKLLPLTLSNKGPTATHMPMSDSGVIDMGDQNVNLDGPDGVPRTEDDIIFDQRGRPFYRVLDGNNDQISTIDIGAVEYWVGPLRVVDVVFSSTDWFRDPFAMSSRVAAGKQLLALPTTGIDTIEIQFSEEVRRAGSLLDGSELKLFSTVWNQPDIPENDELSVASGGLTWGGYDAVNYIAKWNITAPLSNGKYAIHLGDELTNPITDVAGNLLDAEWENPTNGTSDDFTDDVMDAAFDAVFASGDGTAGDSDTDGDGLNDFRFHFAVLAGDYGGDNGVDSGDFLLWQQENGTIGDPNNPADGNGDGNVDILDHAIWSNYWAEPLPLKGSSKYFSHDPTDNEKIEMAEHDDLMAIWQTANDANAVPGDPKYFAIVDPNNDGVVNATDQDLLNSLLNFESAWYKPMAAVANFSAVGPFAQVTNVIVSGSNSPHNPFSFDTVDGSGQQLATVPVGAADTISIVFSEDVYVTAGHLQLIGLSTAIKPNLVTFSYDATTLTASWQFDGWALGDQYLLELSDFITDFAGNALDGEWTNPASITTTNVAVSEFPSGDGTPGGSFNFILTLLPGDANLDGTVDAIDAGILFTYWGIAGGAMFTDGDANGDGLVDAIDFGLQSGNWGVNLQNVWVLTDLDGNYEVDVLDLNIIIVNMNMTGATWADGDLDGDGIVTIADLALANIQVGIEFEVVA